MAHGNHYSRQVQQLEGVINSKLKQLNLLEHENQLLHNKQAALQDAIDGMAGPLSLVKEVLAEAAAAGAAAAGGTLKQDHRQGVFVKHDTSQHSSPQHSSDCSSSAGAADRSGSSLASHLSPSTTYKHTDALLQRIDDCEERVRGALQLLGCVSDSAGHRQLYTTQLLRRAVSHPDIMAGYLNMPKPERLQYWANAHTQMALLLSKYDSNVTLKTGNVRQQLDHLVDELFERVTVCALLDPPQKYMSCFMLNVETGDFEPYPQGWWPQVLEGMALTPEQAAAIKLVWGRIRGTVEQLTQEFVQLQHQLQQVHMQELQQNRQFEHEMQALPSLRHTLDAAQSLQQELRRQLLLPAVLLANGGDACGLTAARPAPVGLRSTITAGEQLLAMLAEQMQEEMKQEQMLNLSSPACGSTALPGTSASNNALQAPGLCLVAADAAPQLGLGGSSAGGGGNAASATATPSHQPASERAVSGSPAAGGSGSIPAPTCMLGCGTFSGPLEEAEEVLLQPGSEERQSLERRIQACQDRLEVLQFTITLQLTNIVSKQQLASMCVSSHPFVFDTLSICEAMDAKGWGS